MIDPELKEYLSKIEKQLDGLAKKEERHWTQFVGGVFYGLGYITGAVVLIVIIGWILNIIGVIPEFTSSVAAFQHALSNFDSSSFR